MEPCMLNHHEKCRARYVESPRTCQGGHLGTGKSYPLRLVQRAQIIQMAADGVQNQDIAQELGVSRPTVQLWRQRFLAFRLEGLEKDAPRPGRIPKIPVKRSKPSSKPPFIQHHPMQPIGALAAWPRLKG